MLMSTAFVVPVSRAFRLAFEGSVRAASCSARRSVGVGEHTAATGFDSVAVRLSKGRAMAKATVEVLVDDLDGSEGVETVRLGWNGEWRELELSKKNLASLSRALDKYWDAARPVSGLGMGIRAVAADRAGRRRRVRPRQSATPR